MHRILLFTCLLIGQSLHAQLQAGLFTGISSYYGDLNDKIFNRSKPAAGISLHYAISDRFSIRSAFTAGKLEGADKYGGYAYQQEERNLEFQSTIHEVSLTGELTMFNMSTINWSPYAFGGVGVFRFSPYATSNTDEKVYLQPLSTEGQGLSGSNTAPYRLTQMSLPFGAGIKWRLSETVGLGIEMGYRKTFTDYIDDVSTNYPDYNQLLEHRGQQAVDLSFRGSHYHTRTDFPSGEMRGNSKKLDSYYFTGVHFIFNLGKNSSSAGRGHSQYSDLKCPPVPR